MPGSQGSDLKRRTSNAAQRQHLWGRDLGQPFCLNAMQVPCDGQIQEFFSPDFRELRQPIMPMTVTGKT